MSDHELTYEQVGPADEVATINAHLRRLEQEHQSYETQISVLDPENVIDAANIEIMRGEQTRIVEQVTALRARRDAIAATIPEAPPE